MPRVLIIGIGNSLRGDDGWAWHLLEQLRQSHPPENAAMITCHQLTPELAARIAFSRRVIFIDSAFGDPPGEIRVSQLSPRPAAAPAFSHHLHPTSLMRDAQALYGKYPEAFTVSVNGEAFDYSEVLSNSVRCSLPAALEVIQQLASRPV